jgi:two-component system, LytTR family, sensor kinase
MVKKILIIGLIAGIAVSIYFISKAFITNYQEVKNAAFNSVFVVFLINALYTFIVTGIITAVNLLLIKKFFEKKYPWSHTNKVKRVIMELLSTNLLSASLITLFVIIQYNLYSDEVKKLVDFSSVMYQSVVVALIINNIIAPLYEAQFLFREWIKSRIETEQLKREKAESQYAVLKSQINPHFLFNSLNTLLTMIADNQEASRYVESLSDFLRYILQTNDKEAVSLTDELNMVNKYIFIQKNRFGDKLIVETDIPEHYLDFLIPPFALQMLLENALKHNVVSREYPLHINIFVEDHYLVVENNIHKKTEDTHSTGVGLVNITNRFKFLSDRKVNIINENGKFKVALPLVKISV